MYWLLKNVCVICKTVQMKVRAERGEDIALLSFTVINQENA